MGGSRWASRPGRSCPLLPGYWSRLCSFLLTAEGLGGWGHNLFFVTHFCCARQKQGRLWGGGLERSNGRRRGNALSGFILRISPPPFTHLCGLEAGLNCSISPQRAVNHTLSNAERWLQAPSAFIINHRDSKDMSPHLQNHWSSDCGHILPENYFPAFFTAQGASGARPRGAVPCSSILKSWDNFRDLILTARPS